MVVAAVVAAAVVVLLLFLLCNFATGMFAKSLQNTSAKVVGKRFGASLLLCGFWFPVGSA